VRLGCLVVPELPLQALRRAVPELADSAFAVAEGEGARARIQAASSKARQLGVRSGQAISEALAFAPGLHVRWLEPALLDDARQAVFDAAYRVSPQVELGESGRAALAWVDADGLSRLWGDDAGTASALWASANRVGFVARAAVGPGKRIAQLAAERGEGVEVVGPEQGRAFVAGLPLTSLTRDADLAETLARWGLRTAGELSALPPDGVGARLGRPGALLHRLCCGEDPEPLRPLVPTERFEEGCHLDHLLVALEGLLFLLRPALERLVERLDCRGFACGGLTLRLQLDPTGEVALPVSLAAPTREVGAMLALCRAVVEAHPPGAPVRGVRLAAEPARVRQQQLGLWDLPTAAPMKLMAAVAQVAAIVGAGGVGRAQLQDSHLFERWESATFQPAPAPTRLPGEPLPEPPPPLAALRLFRPPLPAEVRYGPRGPEALAAPGVNGWVVSWAGPFRLDVGWHGPHVSRDAFDVELSDGAVYRVIHDGTANAFQVVGRYD